MFIVFVGSVVLRDPPLTSVQMLWVNLIMDTCGALALATEPPSDQLLKDKPYPRSDSIITSVMLRNIAGQSLYQIIVLLVLLFAGQEIFGIEYPETATFNNNDNKLTHFTLIFHAFVFMQIFNEINARKIGEFEYNVFAGFFNNFLFIGIVLATIGIQVCMVEYGGAALRTISLSWERHLICIAIGSFSLIQGLLIKLILPARWFDFIKIKDDAMKPEEFENSLMGTLRKSTIKKSHNTSFKVNDSLNRSATRIN